VRYIFDSFPRVGPIECTANHTNGPCGQVSGQHCIDSQATQTLTAHIYHRRKCEAILAATFEHEHGQDAYVLLRSEQLVGTVIFVYAKADLLSSISRVEGASRKVSICAFARHTPRGSYPCFVFRLACEVCRAIRVAVESGWIYTTRRSA
jgi:hypothetical protein